MSSSDCPELATPHSLPSLAVLPNATAAVESSPHLKTGLKDAMAQLRSLLLGHLTPPSLFSRTLLLPSTLPLSHSPACCPPPSHCSGPSGWADDVSNSRSPVHSFQVSYCYRYGDVCTSSPMVSGSQGFVPMRSAGFLNEELHRSDPLPPQADIDKPLGQLMDPRKPLAHQHAIPSRENEGSAEGGRGGSCDICELMPPMNEVEGKGHGCRQRSNRPRQDP